uniref:OSIGBa0146I21.3 protein n=1 Tax=Oryza sativa TaxID=4530 RepID=Q01KS5_ORYSA|nr:OSIGBa0146I21.3 [Oryza sativa]
MAQIQWSTERKREGLKVLTKLLLNQRTTSFFSHRIPLHFLQWMTCSSNTAQRTLLEIYNNLVIFENIDAFRTWHDQLGHPGIGMMRKIIGNSIGHHLITDKFLKSSDFVCTACATGKLILRPSYLKIRAEQLKFLERIQGDICGPIVPRSGPFRLANNLLDAFTNYKGVTKFFIPALNAPERVEVPNKTTQLPLTKKRGRSMATQRDTIANKQRKTVNANQPLVDTHQIDTMYQADRDNLQPISVVHNAETRNSEDHRHIVSGDHDESIRVDEIAINYSKTGESFDRRATIVDTNFSEQIADCLQVDQEPRSIKECQKRSDWNKWKDAIDAELASLYKRDVFLPVMPTCRGFFPVGYKWVFVRKRNENNEVVRYKARLVAQGFTQKSGDDFNETYSPVMSGITFRYLISLAVQNRIVMQLMDVVTTYLYGSLDSDIYMKVLDGIDIPNQKKSLYGLKQSDRMWYNRLSEILSLKGYTKNDDFPCVFIKKSPTGFCFISVYVDDLNIIRNTQDINEACHHLKTEFEMKDLGQTKFCLGLQLDHLPSRILVHQSAYTQKILEKFNMDKSYPSKTPMVVRSLDVEKDPFRPKEYGEDVLGPDFPYLSAIGALMYLANSTRPDIAFSVNLLARYSAAPTKRHWTEVKNVFRYLNGTRDLGLFFKKNQDSTLIGYTDARYLSDPHNARS